MQCLVRRAAILVLMCMALGRFEGRALAAVDLSSPKKAAVAFAAAVQRGDFDAIKASSIGNDEDYKLMKTMAGMMSAAARLHDAATARYGPAEAVKVAGAVAIPHDAAKQIEDSVETVAGDTASITKKGDPEANSLKLKKVDGAWKIDLSQFPQRASLVKTMPMLEAMQSVLSQGATDVSGGKYPTASDAGQDIQRHLFAVMGALSKQSTAPAGSAK